MKKYPILAAVLVFLACSFFFSSLAIWYAMVARNMPSNFWQEITVISFCTGVFFSLIPTIMLQGNKNQQIAKIGRILTYILITVSTFVFTYSVFFQGGGKW